MEKIKGGLFFSDKPILKIQIADAQNGLKTASEREWRARRNIEQIVRGSATNYNDQQSEPLNQWPTYFQTRFVEQKQLISVCESGPSDNV